MRTRLALPTAVIALALLALTPAGAGAKTIHVTTHADEDNGCTPASCSIREAVAIAKAGDVVAVPKGLFPLSGEIDIGLGITVAGAGPAATTLDAGGKDRIFSVGGTGPVTLRGMKLTGGDPGVTVEGGAIDSDTTGGLTLNHMRITKNTISQPSFSGGQGDDGGAGVATTGPLTVLNSSIDHNTIDVHAGGSLTDYGGGGIYSFSAPVTVRKSEVSDNTVAVHGSEQGNHPVARNGGGGIFMYSSGGDLTVDRSTLARNSVTVQSPGAVDHSGGGGIYTEGGTDTITNSTIAGNQAGAFTMAFDNGGGGIYVGGGGVSLASATVAGNAATAQAGSNAGGAVYVFGGAGASAKDTIVAGNSADEPSFANCYGTFASQGHNVEDKDECGLHASGDQPATPIALGPLAFNGGPTRTRAIKQSGAAFDRGAGCPKVDQRGVPRPKGHACDVGAYELAVPNVRTGGVRKVRPHGARLRGTVNPGGAATTFVFRFGKTTAYGKATKRRSAGAGRKPAAVAAPVGGLSPATIYHYKLVAKNKFGTTADGDRTFITNMELPGGCVRNRRLSFDVERPAGHTVTLVKVRVNGKLFSTFGGSDVKHVTLTKLPTKPFKLSVAAKLGGGAGTVRGAHGYSPCG